MNCSICGKDIRRYNRNNVEKSYYKEDYYSIDIYHYPAGPGLIVGCNADNIVCDECIESVRKVLKLNET